MGYLQISQFVLKWRGSKGDGERRSEVAWKDCKVRGDVMGEKEDVEG